MTKRDTDWEKYPDTKPRKSGIYLVVVECKSDDGKNVRHVDVSYFDRESEYCFDFYKKNVIYWMPIPKPPKDS